MSELYTYAVARIRALELSLFSDGTIEALLACPDEARALAYLQEKGWGGADTPAEAEAILMKEEDKIWAVVRELSIDMAHFAVLSYPQRFHNLKAAVKALGTGQEEWPYFYEDEELDHRELLTCLKEKDYNRLPEFMRAAAREATETFAHTGDGQLCDVIIDKAALEAVAQAGRAAKVDIIREYAETSVAVADIKIAVRSLKTGKPASFVNRALAACDTLDIGQLARVSQMNMEALADYLKTTVYAAGAGALNESPSAFERWCDDQMILTIRPEKYHAFTIGPVFAYVIARQNEIKTVRIVLSGLRNHLAEQAIRERVRQMYV